ncbi:MAG: putative DNA methylase [Candidatus Uhrbacteria bacterium GW2011_GWE2_45_35]|uniref:Putative DNA methylase n=2 Tax=Candidatus Uhriibacteriota TaxID=1752732 RepID=A0A0G1MDK7_9BACT|nr:MAG: putative DNA methylase [Candidatus Uhrbacteria bacterium GW2011_GWF2_44_350]KKU06805.1 MAG: putative DNA methylase [Candidatus Uhrbacteria bacterium GW2011_GWE2_45_35]HBR80399.1 hypothetical protein [Candidatus Uhrbacteria bacterium]HCU32032.1 hypothetical protein [Candidatus Uhrbacteria bacterium]
MKFFILGSHPALSIAEIATVVGTKKNYSKCSKEVLLLDEVEQEAETLQERLAGTIKIGEIVGEVKKIDRDEVAELFIALLSFTEKRVTFGISAYSLDTHEDLSSEVKQIGMTLKNKLKEDGRSARFVSAKTASLPSVAVVGEKLLENGAEFVLITSRDKIYLGQTSTVQNFNAWSDRDFGRPARDAKSGMLPPKLARMMINLSGAELDNTVIDPFCGSGTVLMEAALMGFSKIIGGDISEKAIKDSKANLIWLDQNFGTETSKIPLFVQPVETLTEVFSEKVDAVIAETYLGPPLSGHESLERRRQIVAELTERTASALVGLKKLLKKNATLVLALPAVKHEQEISYLPLKKLAATAGFKILDPLPTSLPEYLKSKTSSGGLLYARKEQRVVREIVILK